MANYMKDLWAIEAIQDGNDTPETIETHENLMDAREALTIAIEELSDYHDFEIIAYVWGDEGIKCKVLEDNKHEAV